MSSIVPIAGPLRPRKRPRADPDAVSITEDCAAQLKINLRKDDKFWYSDGSVGLAAQNVGFKVYRGLLAEQSGVFADLFTLPQPPEAQSVEDCPTVHLSGTAQELRALLSIMIHGRKYTTNDSAHLEEIVAWARMSHKNHIQNLLKDAMKRLERFFPSRFDPVTVDRHPVQRKHAIAVVNLARLTDTPRMIPSALYYCCTLDTRILLRGCVRSGGVVDRLAPRDPMRYCEGKTKLAGQFTFCLSRICRLAVNKHCMAPDVCASTIISLHDTLAIGEGNVGKTGALASWGKSMDRAMREHRELSFLCVACRVMLYERDLAERQRVWRELPSYFNSVDRQLGES